MKVGDKFLCPGCHQETVLVLHRVMSGWRVEKEILVCFNCKIEIGASSDDEPKELGAAAQRLATLFGENEVDNNAADEKVGIFCKNCKYFVVHPFLSRCGLHKKETDPMSDCNDFQERPHS